MSKFSNILNKLKTNRKTIIQIILLAIISLIIAVVFESFYSELIIKWIKNMDYNYAYLNEYDLLFYKSTVRMVIVFLVSMFIGFNFIFNLKKLYEFICDKRYFIAGAFLLFVMAFELNGSSLGRVNNFIYPESREMVYSETLGLSRDLRTDEWGTQSLYILSQEENGYENYSNSLRATDTNMFTLVNAPTESILMIGKPFQILFLLIDNVSVAFSFYWYARITLMCLATFEVMMILTNKKKLYSLAGMILIAFSSATQWWYCLDALIWGQVILILLNLFFETDKIYTKVLCALGEVVALLAFIFVFYPAWQITFVYILIPVFVYIVERLVKNKKEVSKGIRILEVVLICLTCAITIAMVAYWLYTSMDAIEISFSTVYPGAREETGGGEGSLLAYFYNMYMPYREFEPGGKHDYEYFKNGLEEYMNQCEAASMLSLFPIPMILAVLYLIKGNKKDLYLKVSLAVAVLLSVFSIIGLPSIFAKLSLLSMSTGARAAVPLAALNIYMLMYIVSRIDENEEIVLIKNKFIPVIISIGLMILCMFGDGNNHLKLYEIILSCVLFTLMFYMSLNLHKKELRNILLLLMSVVTLIGGLTVNPVLQSTDIVKEQALSKHLQEYAEKDPDAVWMVNKMSLVFSNYLVANGLDTITSTNVYPNVKLYEALFPEDIEKELIWNRYHHIEGIVTTDDTDVEKITEDSIRFEINYKDLEKIGIDYIISRVNIENKYREIDNLELVEKFDVFYIYKVIEQELVEEGE